MIDLIQQSQGQYQPNIAISTEHYLLRLFFYMAIF